ncbi:hypothetical protein KTS45_17375 [Halomicroarcula limicola]|uniref:UbiD operon protein n=1 Tax=Haloarcula limicola TaxID=1429915 RepID=A0A8J8C560_9EURY|nr:hypothetical protein [Halomicroarcula limicola]MBV0925977.1 hypothetical protein [Halomicroarcula limicola]
MTRYSTAEENLPDDPEGEVRLQLTNTDTKEIFVTRARVAKSETELDDPEPLTVVRGPHENIKEDWYIEILEANPELEEIDEEILQECIEYSRTESNVINARSEDARALLQYLVAVDEFDSVSDAVRTIVNAYMRETYPELLDAYLDAKAERIRDDLSSSFGDSK